MRLDCCDPLITAEINRYDNVIYDICDEPTINGGKDSEVIPWLLAKKDAFLEAERALPKKHVLGQTVQSSSPDLSGNAWCDWLPTEYVAAAQAAFEKNYGANKPIVNVESDYYGYGLVKPYTVDDVRAEGWWFMLGGGAGCISLNGEYYRGQETGGSVAQARIVPEKKVLRGFMESLNLVALHRFTGLGGIPSGAFASAIAEPGRQYALYLFHGKNDTDWGAHYVVTRGNYKDTLTLISVPAGDYGLEWIEPASGKVMRTETKTHSGGNLQVETPPYMMDVALRMRRSAAPKKRPSGSGKR